MTLTTWMLLPFALIGLYSTARFLWVLLVGRSDLDRFSGPASIHKLPWVKR